MSGIEVRAAIAPPPSRQHDAQTVCHVRVRGAHPSRVPLHEHQLSAVVLLAARQDSLRDAGRPMTKRRGMCVPVHGPRAATGGSSGPSRPARACHDARSAADVLADHMLFEIEAIDRVYLNLYQPGL